MSQNKCQKCNADLLPHLIEDGHCFACVTRKAGRSARLRRLMSTELVDVGPGGNCVYCGQSFEKNRVGMFLSDGKMCAGCSSAIGYFAGKTFGQIVHNLASEWLLKSSGRILGPFTSTEIEKKLLSNEVVALDEVCKPFERWKYVRDEVAFAKVIEQIRLRKAGKGEEDTGTNTHVERATATDFTVTQDQVETVSVTDTNSDQMIDVQARVTSVEKTPSQENGDVPQYGSTTDKKVRVVIERSFRWMWSFPILAVCGLIGWLLMRSIPEVKEQDFEALYREGVTALDFADYMLALKKFKKALALRPTDADTALRVSALMVFFEGETGEAQRILGRILEGQRSWQIMKEANLILALAHMQDNNFSAAKKALGEALNIDGDYGPALLNMAYLYFKEDRLVDAIKTTNRIDVPKATHVSALKDLLTAIFYIRQGDLMRSNWNYRQALEVASRHANLFQELGQEALLLAEIAKHKLSRKMSNIEKILDFDPEITFQFIPDILVYPRVIDWDLLLGWCEAFVRSLPKSAANEGLLGFCHMRSNNVEKARKFYYEATLDDPTSLLLSAVYGFFMLSLGNDESAKAAISNSNFKSHSTAKLPLLLKARTCSRASDWNCAKENFEKLNQVSPNDLSSIAGLAEVYWRLNDLPKAHEWLGKGLAISNRYKPLIWLKKELGGGPAKN